MAKKKEPRDVFARMPRARKVYGRMYPEDREGVLGKAVWALITTFVEECDRWEAVERQRPTAKKALRKELARLKKELPPVPIIRETTFLLRLV